MSCNVIVSSINFSSLPVEAPCPVDVVVRVENVGQGQPTFTAQAHIFEVALESNAFATEGANRYIQAVTVPSDWFLPSRNWIDVVFPNVIFRGGGAIAVTAIADFRSQVTNNLRSRPFLVKRVHVQPVAWLWTTKVEFGLTDSSGLTAFPVTTLCPGLNFWVQATVTNEGLADAPASSATLSIFDDSGQVAHTVNVAVPPIGAGLSQVVTFPSGYLTPAPPSSSVAVEVCADVAGVVSPQCDRAHLCAAATAEIASSGSPPQLTFQLAQGGPILPGQPVFVDWAVQNSCADLGRVQATISFEGTTLYTSTPQAVGLQSSGGESNIPITAASQRQGLMSDFWSLQPPAGSQSLHLVVTGSGKDSGPYISDLPFAISPETISPSWWSWDPAPAGPDVPGAVDWNTVYGVSGHFTNNTAGHEQMDVSLLFTEADDEAGSPGVATGNAFSTTLAKVSAGASAASAWSGLKQSWQWLAPAVWIPDGPESKPFGYTVAFTITNDGFNNGYPPVSSAELVVEVSVAPSKLFLQNLANLLEGTALCFAIAGAVAAAGGVVTFGISEVTATNLFELAAATEAAAVFAGTQAEDPPAPDFGYLQYASPSPWIPPGSLGRLMGSVAYFTTSLEIVRRCLDAVNELGRLESVLWGARIDNDAAALARLTGFYLEQFRLLEVSATAFPTAAGELVSLVEAVGNGSRGPELREQFEQLKSNGIPGRVLESWREAGCEVASLGRLEAALKHPGLVIASPRDSLYRLSANLSSLVEAQRRVMARFIASG